jgi:hypothetical protein
MKTPIPFRDQFLHCKEFCMVGVGAFRSFEDYPELLPLFPNKKMFEAIKSGEFKGFFPNICLKFGGDCNGGNVECRKMRGLE